MATEDSADLSAVRTSRLSDGEALPLVIEPASQAINLAEWVRRNHAFVEWTLSQHGGILFRGFGLSDAAAFERVASAVCGGLYADYGDLPRETLAEKVYGSTPYPADKSILYHNESSHLSRWPSRINFFALTVAEEGGATPIVDCRKVYNGLDPAVRDAFEQKGLMYVRNFCGLDVSWQRFFGTDDKAEVERACASAGATCEWLDENQLRTRQRCRAVIVHPRTGEKTFFNQVQLHHPHCLDADTREALLSMLQPEEMPRFITFGDGTAIDGAMVDHVGEIYEKYAVRFQWQPYDMVSLDNMLVAHARDPFKGARKIVVALGNMCESGDV
jgi:alpha-ketoglutarate-dependent taurine dioxygenase